MTEIINGEEQGGGASTFEDLTDAETMVGSALKFWRTNAGETALEAATPAGGGDVTAAANVTAARIVIGDDGAKGVKESVVAIDASGNMTGMLLTDTRNLETDGAKLDLIEAAADVTDATNVNTAGAVMEVDFNAQTILAATSDDTPAALTVTEQTVVGRLTGGNVAAVALGISDNNIVQIDGTANDTEWAIFSAAGLEGLTDAMAKLSGDAAAAFSFNEQALTNVGNIGCDEITLVDGYSINLQEAITFTGATTENLIEIPDALAVALDITEAANSYLKFKTTDGSELITSSKKFLSVLNMYFSDEGGEHILGDGTDLTISSGALINLTATSDVVIPVSVGLIFGDGAEKIESDNTDLTIASGGELLLSATSDVVIPVNIGLHFGDGAEKIESDNADLTINSGGELLLTATSDVVIPVNIGLHLGDGTSKLESDDTDLTINAGGDINLTAVGDVNIPVSVGLTWGDGGEHIEADNTNLTITTAGELRLSSATDVVIPVNVGLHFGDGGENIEGDDANLTVTSAGDIKLAGGFHGIRYVMLTAVEYATDCSVADNLAHFHVPAGLNGMDLVEVHAEVLTAGTTGTMTVEVYNTTQAAQMLSTNITLDTGETGSDTAATPPVIDAGEDDIATNDVITINITGIHTAAAKGLIATLGFQLP